MAGKSGWSGRDNRLLEAVLALAAVLAGVFGILIPVLGVADAIDPVDTRGVEIGSASRVPADVTASTGGHGMSLTGTHRADLVLAHPGFGERLLLALPGLVGSVLLLLALFLLLRIAGTLRDGDVFVPENARRLSVIGLAALVQAVLSPLLPALTTQLLVRGTPLADEIPFTVTFTGEYLLLGFLVLALAEVFRRGTKLRADTEGLV
ncbi:MULTISPECIES: DUF2975 domain-containing protein [unclassified Streptomyces]|uniref:DUF2975 domain-containing protein n=1 Tax=unclassified Streptomyces TaxID=2593676 RepID=UPI00037C979A|nr:MULTISPECIES: DUF2975 domain-containing protein [unclassified Streptomyces]